MPSDDELSILLSFHLELPLTQILDAAELQKFIPPSSPLWPIRRASARPALRASASPDGPTRPLCLLTLLAPTPVEAELLAGSDPTVSRWHGSSLMQEVSNDRSDHAVPEVFAQLYYTIVTVVALIRCGINLHTIGAGALAGNIRWFLEQAWLDNHLRPPFLAGLTELENQPPFASDQGAKQEV